ncbi:large ribosomal subunit protein bL9m [Phlebotomus argentipes]|uniref:large ribosomal subunit protein bL9m n=1 Tax=Phlebotomus argentipes TaxID=94469 RepID=UPI0028934145|nr:large ribosomal subunit protein bL9m [Phlebotomus argentipes]
MLRSCLIASRGSSSGILGVSCANIQQKRNTFILKRRWPPGLHKKNESPKAFRPRHYVYDLLEDTEFRKTQPIEVILTTFVETLGQKGDIVSVKPKFAHNNLLLPGLAVYKTERNLEKYKKDPNQPEPIKYSSPFALKTMNMIEGLLLPIVMNKEEPWVVEKWHVRASLRKAGFHAPDEALELPDFPIKGPNLDLENKEFIVTVTINGMEKAKLRCRIHHWSTDPVGKLPYLPEFWTLPSVPITP